MGGWLTGAGIVQLCVLGHPLWDFEVSTVSASTTRVLSCLYMHALLRFVSVLQSAKDQRGKLLGNLQAIHNCLLNITAV